MRDRARVVVIGGGVGGCAILYWLTKLGWDDVVLVERADLTSGSTFHSAGLVGQLRGSLSLTKMMMSSVDLYRTLGDEVGLETGWHEVGSLRLASSRERMEEIARQAGWAKTFGLPLELVSADEASRLFPPMSADGVLGAAYLPTDGYIDPSQLTFALAEGARRGGAEIATQTRVTAVDVHENRVRAVDTDKGRIETEIAVDAGGMFAAEIGTLAGVVVPVVPMAHEYLITRPAGVPLDLPTMRDPSLLVYFRGESGGLVMGGYERNPAAWGLDGIPPDFNGKLLEEDWDRFEELLQNAIVRVPMLAEAEVVRLVNGPEAFTPDGEFILGPTDVRGFWVAAGFCAHGLAGAGGMGKLVAEWIVDGLPSLDVWEMDSRRFGAHYASREYTLARTTEVYATYYDVKYPGHEREAGRPLRLSPAYPRLTELGASFGEKSGWERANWFEPNAANGDESLRPRGWAGRHWSPAIEVEHGAVRETAALFDETSFAKIEVAGYGAADFLERLCDNRVARDVGAITYTSMLNQRGGIECDFTVTRLAEDRFRIVTGTAFGRHDLAWIVPHAPDGVRVDDVTSRFACLGIWGPSARDVLQPLTATALGTDAFPYMRARELAVGPVPCLALRVTYVGELGWELYCPTEFGLALWDTIWEAGRGHGLVAGGYRAIDSCRLEKGYRVWGADITPEDTPYE
ncbi:MAG: FAD-dependent oxidoreductase, partial [Gaiellaceae bacterium]